MYKLTANFSPGTEFAIISNGEVSEGKEEFDPQTRSTRYEFTSKNHFGISVKDKQGNSLARFYPQWEGFNHA